MAHNEEHFCARCGTLLTGTFKVIQGWRRFQWSDTLPVRMRTRESTCQSCGAKVEVTDIQKYEGRLLDIKRVKKKPLSKTNCTTPDEQQAYKHTNSRRPLRGRKTRNP